MQDLSDTGLAGAEVRQEEVAREAEAAIMIAPERIAHWEGCWKDPGHHDCAIRLLEGFQRRFESARRGQVEEVPGFGRCVAVPQHWKPGDRVRVLRVEDSSD